MEEGAPDGEDLRFETETAAVTEEDETGSGAVVFAGEDVRKTVAIEVGDGEGTDGVEWEVGSDGVFVPEGGENRRPFEPGEAGGAAVALADNDVVAGGDDAEEGGIGCVEVGVDGEEAPGEIEGLRRTDPVVACVDIGWALAIDLAEHEATLAGGGVEGVDLLVGPATGSNGGRFVETDLHLVVEKENAAASVEIGGEAVAGVHAGVDEVGFPELGVEPEEAGRGCGFRDGEAAFEDAATLLEGPAGETLGRAVFGDEGETVPPGEEAGGIERGCSAEESGRRDGVFVEFDGGRGETQQQEEENSQVVLDLLFYGLVRVLTQLLARETEDVALDVAALEMAAIEFPGLEAEPFLSLFDSYAAELGERISEETTGEEYVRLANAYLFDELGFAGNTEDYYHPRNSCLSEALVQRTGLPITLSLVYMEISRRLERPVFGIGMPGHFLVMYDDGEFACYIDPFHKGRVLTPEECYSLAREVTGTDIEKMPDALAPASKRHIVLRMLNNLRTAYFRLKDHEKALQVLDLLLIAMPESAEEHKQRGLVHLQLRHFVEAQQDLERYLRLSDPGASDREEIEKRLEAIRAWLAALN